MRCGKFARQLIVGIGAALALPQVVTGQPLGWGYHAVDGADITPFQPANSIAWPCQVGHGPAITGSSPPGATWGSASIAGLLPGYPTCAQIPNPASESWAITTSATPNQGLAHRGVGFDLNITGGQIILLQNGRAFTLLMPAAGALFTKTVQMAGEEFVVPVVWSGEAGFAAIPLTDPYPSASFGGMSIESDRDWLQVVGRTGDLYRQTSPHPPQVFITDHRVHVVVRVPANSGAERTGTITVRIAGQTLTLTVTQPGNPNLCPVDRLTPIDQLPYPAIQLLQAGMLERIATTVPRDLRSQFLLADGFTRPPLLDAEIDRRATSFQQVIQALYGLPVARTSGFRPEAYQEHLYQIGRRRMAIMNAHRLNAAFVQACSVLLRDIETHAAAHELSLNPTTGGYRVNPPGMSAHELGLAIDLGVQTLRMEDVDGAALGAGLFASFGGDGVHFVNADARPNELVNRWEVLSPVAVMITDPSGRRVGVDLVTGTFVNELGTRARHSGVGTEPTVIEIGPLEPGTYVLTGVGTGSGPYRIRIVRVTDGNTDSVLTDVTGTASPGTAIPPLTTVVAGDDNDGLPALWETAFGLNPESAAGADGPDGDPDGDGLANRVEHANGTHPRGFFTRYLAEGAINNFFDVRLALLNVDSQPARMLFRFLQPGGTTLTRFEELPPGRRRTLTRADLSGLTSPDFSTVLESDRPIVL